jgi:hypothetical protein
MPRALPVDQRRDQRLGQRLVAEDRMREPAGERGLHARRDGKIHVRNPGGKRRPGTGAQNRRVVFQRGPPRAGRSRGRNRTPSCRVLATAAERRAGAPRAARAVDAGPPPA